MACPAVDRRAAVQGIWSLLLVLEGGAREIEVHLVRAGLLLGGVDEPDPEPRVVARQERDAVMVGRRSSPSPGRRTRSARDRAGRSHRSRPR